MSGKFLETSELPFCKGCGHSIVMMNVEAALSGIAGLKLNDVVMVSDIGCIGIIDRQFATHTVHGLHGRSVALASGIAMGLKDRGKKIIVLLGDGGATIGLQHLLDAAHRDLDMTVIVHNNMLYGMTGGQPSSLTPCGYRTQIMPEGKPDKGVDLCSLVSAAGAPYVARMNAAGDFSGELREAFEFKGFAFVEMLELCTSHGTKLNPGRSLRELGASAGLALGRLASPSAGPAPGEGPKAEGPAGDSHAAHAAPASAAGPASPGSLFPSFRPIGIREEFSRKPEAGAAAWKDSRLALLLAGSAGEGVQSAAELLAKAAMSCGLHVSKKGSYPVTVGVGFSVAEVIISTRPIRFTGTMKPDVLIVTSREGLGKVRGQLSGMDGGQVYADSSLALPATGAALRILPYRQRAGDKSACLLAVMDFLRREKAIPEAALADAMLAGRNRAGDPALLAHMLED